MALNNEVRLIGFCGSRPKLITTKSGSHLAVLSVYTLDIRKQSVNGESERHRCVLLGKQAELACKLIEVGSHVHLRGYLRSSTYLNQKDEEVRSSEILIEDFCLSPKEKATAMFKRNLREMIRDGDLDCNEILGE